MTQFSIRLFARRFIASCGVLLVWASVSSQVCHADSALSYRFGSFGFGIDFDQKINESINVRAGYNFYRYGRKADSSGVHYEATANVRAASLLMDWYYTGSPWHLTTGISQSGLLLKAEGQPTGTVTFNGQTYNASDIGSLSAEFAPRHSVAPYIGIGYGRTISHDDRFHFLFDVGALYVGSPEGQVNASCGSAVAAPECAQLLADISAELQEYENKWRRVRWWPVVSVGFAMSW